MLAQNEQRLKERKLLAEQGAEGKRYISLLTGNKLLSIISIQFCNNFYFYYYFTTCSTNNVLSITNRFTICTHKSQTYLCFFVFCVN